MSVLPQDPGWSVVYQAGAQIGELPIWEPFNNCLYWTDLYGPTLNEFSLGSGFNRSWVMPEMTGGYGLFPEASGALVSTSAGVYVLDFATGLTHRRFEAPYDQEHFRFNDGRTDPRGRLWLGANRKPRSGKPDGSGGFWRLDREGWSDSFDGVTIANGLAFSPLGDLMYIADSTNDQIIAFSYDPDAGRIGERRVFATTPPGGFPDGAAIDIEGGYWSALFNGDLIIRFDAAGRLDRVLSSPVPQPTMVAFGGPGLRTMFLTTSRRFMPEDERARFPLAGAIFSCQLDIAGIAEPHVAR